MSGDSTVTILDPQSLAVISQVRLPDADIWRILRRLEKFYLLNAGSRIRNRDSGYQNDIFSLTPGGVPNIEVLAVAPSPYVGDLDGSVLWSFHDPMLNQPNNDSRRQISRFDEASHQKMIWSLPKNWRVDDLKVIDGRVILARWDSRTNSEDGLYEFDPGTGRAEMILNVPGASQVILDHATSSAGTVVMKP